MSASGVTHLVSVVICVKDREALIGDALRSIVQNHPHEIVVVDGQSKDRTVEIARQFTDRIVSDNGGGLAAARQLGAETATQPYVMYVDSDVVLGEGCITALVEELEADPGLASSRADIRNLLKTSYWSRSLEAARELRPTERQREHEIMGFGCMATLVRRDLILKYKFDRFFTGAVEDLDFYYRLLQDGWRFSKNASAPAYHRNRDSFASFFKQRVWYGRGVVRGAAKGMPNARRTMLPSRQHRTGLPLLIHALRTRRFDLLPLIFVQAAAHYTGVGLELTSLRLARLKNQRRDSRTGARP